MKKFIFIMSILFSLLFSSCFKYNYSEVYVGIVNATDNTIRYEGTQLVINDVSNKNTINYISTHIFPADSEYSETPILRYIGDNASTDEIEKLLSSYDLGKVVFNDSTFIDYRKSQEYPKSPYTNLELERIDDFRDGYKVITYIYSIDEADHQWAIEHNSQP